MCLYLSLNERAVYFGWFCFASIAGLYYRYESLLGHAGGQCIVHITFICFIVIIIYT